jgi:TonB family protein
MVSVTGANAGADGARHLFSEETTTVLVFKDGAVIRLAAPVSVGQLLFLTNKKSNQEVVCQVLKKRSFKPPQSYVELQFTEERENYWGVAFPEGEQKEFEAPEQVQAEETTAEEQETPVEPQSAEAVDQLKQEVEALREQLRELEKRNAETAAAKAMAEAAAAREAAAREEALREAAEAVEAAKAEAQARAQTQGAPGKLKEQLASVNEPAPIPAAAHAEAEKAEAKKEDLLMPPASKAQTETTRAVVSMALPVWKSEKSPVEQLLEEESAAQEATKKVAAPPVAPMARDAAEELLPKPALDFSKAPKVGKVAAVGGGVITPLMPKRPPLDRRRVLLMSALLLVVLGAGAWYGNWLGYLGIGQKAAVTSAGAVRRPNPVRNAAAAIAKAVTGAKSDAPAANDKNAAGQNGSAEAASEKSLEEEAAAEARRVAARERAAKKNTTEKVEAQPNPADLVPVDAPVLPAKLVKPVNPVYPPDAMRSYITGDVKAEVVVEASGRVGDVKVVSGPKALRDAAVEALKQYQYAPATQGGKAIESKTVEVVKFWYNP